VVDLLAPVQGEQDGAAVAELISRLDRALGEGGLARKTDLKASDAAAAVGVSARELAKALGEARGASFSEYILRKRVELALRLLRDPAERRTSMEAIGLLAGFGSRSAFYSAFTKQVGETPSAFRKRNGEDSCPDS
jgi:AraC-like DNA-binding protein